MTIVYYNHLQSSVRKVAESQGQASAGLGQPGYIARIFFKMSQYMLMYMDIFLNQRNYKLKD